MDDKDCSNKIFWHGRNGDASALLDGRSGGISIFDKTITLRGSESSAIQTVHQEVQAYHVLTYAYKGDDAKVTFYGGLMAFLSSTGA